MKHTEFNDLYEELRNKYLLNDVSKWFIEKRNEVLKQQPFDLEKKILITIYSEGSSVTLPEKVFTIENDLEYSILINSLKSFFLQSNPIETMFSAEFSFKECGKDEDLYEQFISGTKNMKAFISELKNSINEECQLSEQLIKKIDNFLFHQIPKNMLLIDDYVYYCEEDKFEKGSRAELSQQSSPVKSPISFLHKFMPQDATFDSFQSFVLMHVIIYQMQRDMMPAYMCIYEDDTFSLTPFKSTIKTTGYRKFGEIAKQIEIDKIKEIFFVTEMLIYEGEIINDPEFASMNSRNREIHATSEDLAFFRLGKDLAHKSYYFECEKIDNKPYVGLVLASPQILSDFRMFYAIAEEFKRLNMEQSVK
ncbi:hypothetical protein [Elizabethkingia ursingii]|uniref:DUF2357 domain-containing protein n=1 Tax=Elizabethkingia ursingii TaxID=1756150 RepID=A0ABX3N7F6_9FLAO|nr:hypothetical protein [Elizabethkingia ursingii]OPB87020.1 hypothetical protein BB021_10940 [Elizabethkingia ursingii]